MSFDYQARIEKADFSGLFALLLPVLVVKIH
jgi:hypothetical protein